MHDVAIVGAGPAGSTVARLIGRNLKVLLLERKDLEDPRERPRQGKCCGGLLAPDAQAMLSRMGLGLPRDVLVGPQLFVVRSIDLPHRIERFYQRYYINLDRLRFDRWLLSLVPSGVDIRTGCRLTNFTREGGGYTIRYAHKGRLHVEKARLLVGADGARSAVRRLCAPGHPFPRAYFAIQEWTEAHRELPYFSAIFDQGITDYYCWAIPKDGMLIIGAALTPRQDVTGRMARLKEQLRAYGFRFGKTLRREGGFLLRPTAARQICVGQEGLALVGEAAGWISPSSAEGLSYAFKSALALADTLRGGLDRFETRLHRATRSLRRNIRLKNLKARIMYSPALRHVLMRSGLQALDILQAEDGGASAPE